MSRWITVLGRIGTVIIAASLALFLVSLIPPVTVGRGGGEMHVLPEEVFTSYSRTLTPQQELKLMVTVEGAINVYLLEVGREPLVEVANATALQNSDRVNFRSLVYASLFVNVTELEKFLEEHPDLIIWEYNLENEVFEMNFSPTRVMNATVVFYNPSLGDTTFDFEVILQSIVAPREKMLTIAFWTTPVGVVLLVPWFVNMLKQKDRKH